MAVEQQNLIPQSIFRAYDIRGIVDKTLTADTVYLIGKVLGSMVRELGDNQMLIARDGRHSGLALSAVLSKGINSVGCEVLDLGMVPTPLLYFATSVYDQNSGVMLTGSHNPADYNGLKMVVGGETLAEAAIQQIYQRIQRQDFYQDAAVAARNEIDLTDRYLNQICQHVHLKRPLKVVIDAGSGITGMLAPALYRKLGCEVVELFCEVDGSFPHHHADPSQVENLQDLIRVVKEQNADIGLAFDGDGDRLGVVTNRGEIIWPDRLLMLYAQSLLKNNAGAKIIYDVKCTTHLQKLICSLGGQPVMWKTGHSLIKAKMKELHAILAGEMSGHFFFKDHWNGYDDALYAGARLLEILSQNTASSAEIFSRIPNSINTPELKVYVKEEEKFSLMKQLIDCAAFKDASDVTTIDGLRVNFSDGWGLVRPSNTSPYLVLRFEALSQPILDNIQLMFKEWMLSVRPDLVLPF